MDDETGKLFVGGLSWETSQDKLQDYFSRYGEIIDCVVMKNSESGRSRGFGFVTFSDPANVALVLQTRPHTLDGRTIDPKPCNPRSLQKPKRECYPKIFLGGLPSNITETDLRTYFTRFGKVVKVVIMYDQSNKKSRGFGFLSFEHNESVERCVSKQYVFLNGKKVEIKKAQPREEYDEKRSLSDEETRSTSKSSISSDLKNKNEFNSFESNANGLSSSSQKFMNNNTDAQNGWGTSHMISPSMWSLNNHKQCQKPTENNSVINWNSWNMPQCGIMAGPYGDTFISQRYVPVTSAATFPIAVPNIGCLVNSNQPNLSYTQNYGVDNIVVQGQLQSLFFNTIGSPMGTYITQSPNNRMFHTFMPPIRTDIVVDRKGQDLSSPGGDITPPKTDPKQNFCKPVQQQLFHPYRR